MAKYTSGGNNGDRVDGITRDPRVPSIDQLMAINYDLPSEKRKLSYGLKLSKELWSYVTTGNEGYYSVRYKDWKDMDLWAKGQVDNTDFQSYMGVEGNKAWINIDWSVIKVMPRYEKSVVNRFMNRDEKPNVRATDVMSQRFREREKELARYRMEQQQRIQAMEQRGMKLEGSAAYTPESDDALEMYYKLEWRMPEESFMEDTVWKILQNSNYEYLKRSLLTDGVRKNIMVTKIEEVPGASSLSNRIRVRRCIPKNTVYNIFQNADGSDVSMVGEAIPMSIQDARRKYPEVSEKDWFGLAQVLQKGLLQAEPLNWVDNYITMVTRPYDDYKFIAFDFEVKVYDQDYYVVYKDDNGKTGIARKKGPSAGSDSARPLNVGRINWYSGLWAVNTDVMLRWDILDNQIKPFQNGVDSFSSYSIVYPDADGFYVPSLMQRGVPCVRQMILIALKIQQMIALMEPENMAVDINGLHEVDLGTGAALKPLQLMSVKKQTGVAYWDSADTSGTGEGGGSIPFQNIPNSGNVAQINVLIALYNFWLARLNEEWGENAETLGQPTAAKKSAAATNASMQAGAGASEYIYDYFQMLMEINATKIVYRLWDMLVFEGMQYKEVAGIERDMIDTTFDVNIDMVDKKGRKERLMARIQEALDSKLITMSTAERLEDIENPKTAILYLERVERKAMEQEQNKMMMQMKMNGMIQQQSTQIASEGRIKEIQAQMQGKAIVESMKGKSNEKQQLLKIIGDVEKEATKAGVPVPMDVAVLKQMLVQDALLREGNPEGQQPTNANLQQGPGEQGPQQQQGQPDMSAGAVAQGQ